MNKEFHRLENNNNNEYYITNKKYFKKSESPFKKESVLQAFEFAFAMTFGLSGEHRKNRSGGSHYRKPGEIFADTFQGKLAELAIYNSLFSKKIKISKPDFQTYGLNKWDDHDFIIDGKCVSIKSTKKFGNLLLLEKKDWNDKAEYIPNIDKNAADIDFFVLVRLSESCEDIMKKQKWYYSSNIDKECLKEEILKFNWYYDIPGFITKEDLIYLINNKYIIPKGAKLNGKISMDAGNYYVQAGDMRNINNITI